MKKQLTWLLMTVLLVNLTAQTICFASSGSTCLNPKKKKAVATQNKTGKKVTQAKYWVLGALFKA